MAESLKAKSNQVDELLDKVLSSTKPTAIFTAPNFKIEIRPVKTEDMESLGDKIKEKLNAIDSYHNMDEDNLCDSTSDVSSSLSSFAEMVFLKSNEPNNTALTENLKRNLTILTKEITTRNQAVVERTNKFVDAPEDENNGKLLKAACKNIRISIDSALDLAREASPKKDFRDQVLQAAGDIERAAKEW